MECGRSVATVSVLKRSHTLEKIYLLFSTSLFQLIKVVATMSAEIDTLCSRGDRLGGRRIFPSHRRLDRNGGWAFLGKVDKKGLGQLY